METVRKFKGSDAFLAESARTIYQLFLQDLPQFTAFNARFTPEYAATFLSQIDAADTVVTDVSTLAKQGVETQKVLIGMQEASRVYNRIKSHAAWAFPNNPAVLKEFTTGYRGASKNQPKMLVFLETLEKVVTNYLDDLTDVTKGGMPAAIAAELATIKETLKGANTQQEVYKKQRLVITQDRINALNDCYATLVQICNIAQLVFANEPAKRAQYTYRPTTSSTTVTDFVGQVAPNETKVITSISYNKDHFIGFENRGETILQFDISTDEVTLEGNMVELESGAINNQPMEWLLADVTNGTKVNILVYNPSTTSTGSYWVSTDV
ncbi:hypothetical protein ACQY1Q_12200 [Tenacibaculum sp. TC6]|uniref:hypothetical protein n=1 Tax=Tenacibaculum sp. TC6 TaxID=3423223 RepID=UPI003D361207